MQSEDLLRILKALADESRLRLVRLLARESLNVGELCRVVGLAQSSVSQKLAELRRAGLVAEQRQGGFSYYTLAPLEPGSPLALLLRDHAQGDDAHGDLARLKLLLQERAEAGDSGGKLVEPGRSWVAWAHALRFLIPPLRVADLGCGDGALTAEIAAWAKSVLAVEKSAAALARARERIARLGLDNVTFLHQSMETLRPRRESLDLVLVSHTLHHVADPAAALAPAVPGLARGGRLLVLELAPHGEEWVREKLGHTFLGFAPAALEKLLTQAGLTGVTVEPVAGKATREPFRILIATGVKP